MNEIIDKVQVIHTAQWLKNKINSWLNTESFAINNALTDNSTQSQRVYALGRQELNLELYLYLENIGE